MSSTSGYATRIMPELFARYVYGEIRDTHWSRFMDVLDANVLTSADREAFSAFFMDCLDEVGDGDVFLPIREEAFDVTGTVQEVGSPLRPAA